MVLTEVLHDAVINRWPLSQGVSQGCARCFGGRLVVSRGAGAGGGWRTAAGGFPLVDYHVHLDNSTIDEVLGLSRARNVKFGIVEHAGGKENVYPVVLSSDEELRGYLKMLEGKGVYRGIQAEWKDWMTGFSREALAELDYVLTDTMTFPGKSGERVKLWEAGVEDRVDLSDPEAFMDRYVDWHLEIMENQPIDLLANVSWLPEAMAARYEEFWTERRIRKVLDSALQAWYRG